MNVLYDIVHHQAQQDYLREGGRGTAERVQNLEHLQVVCWSKVINETFFPRMMKQQMIVINNRKS